MKLAAIAALLLVARVAVANEPDAERAFREAMAKGDIAALEQLGAQRPLTRWSDDAWAEAARLAVRANDFARARTDFEHVIAIGSDEQLVRRARVELERLASFTGSAGEWSAVVVEHERLAPAVNRRGDPRPALEALEQLVRAHPRYPRAPMLMVTIGQGWEREGDARRAIRWLREAKTTAATRNDRHRAQAELARTLIRTGHLADARTEIDALARDGALAIPGLRKDLATAELRRTIRYVMWAVLALIAAAAVIALRRAAGSWRAAARRLVRPPTEAMFLLPIGGVLVAIALTGNPLIARTVVAIVVAGLVTSWLSGAILDGQRGRVRLARVAIHAALAVIAIIAATYLAVERGHVIDFVIETWKSGHELG